MKLVNLREVLREVNRARIAMGKNEIEELPTGDVGETNSCPLARALGGDVGTVLAFESGNNRVMKANAVKHAWKTKNDIESYSVKLPSILSRFVGQFDGYKFPKLIRKCEASYCSGRPGNHKNCDRL